MFKNKYISPFEEAFGVWEKVTQQVPDTYAHYADIAMETLLDKLMNSGIISMFFGFFFMIFFIKYTLNVSCLSIFGTLLCSFKIPHCKT